MEILRLYIEIGDVYDVRSPKGEVRLITFGGTCKGNYFTGSILPGGVDFQRNLPDGNCSLSARYIVEGVDKQGNKGRVFIENNGVMTAEPNTHTRPTVYTDLESLRFLEEEELYGVMEHEDEQLVISVRVYDKEEK